MHLLNVISKSSPRVFYHAKCKKCTAQKIRKAIKKQIQYVKQDLGYADLLLAQDGVCLKPKQTEWLALIRELVEQQQYMYDCSPVPAVLAKPSI